MKWLTSNRFFRILKRFILLLPFTFVLVSSLYVVFNPNAKDSYYGETINEEQTYSASLFDMDYNVTYTFTNPLISIPESWDSSSDSFYISNFTDLSNLNLDAIPTNFSLSFASNGRLGLRFYNSDGLIHSTYYLNTSIISFSFTYVSFSGEYNKDFIDSYNLLTYSVYNEYSYLNNAFEYGLYEFNNIGFGKIDLVSWFSSLFATDVNNVYIQFANSYFNYFIFVECVAILPMFFHWIIHLFEDAIDFLRIGNKKRKGNNDD